MVLLDTGSRLLQLALLVQELQPSATINFPCAISEYRSVCLAAMSVALLTVTTAPTWFLQSLVYKILPVRQRNNEPCIPQLKE